MRSNVPQEGGRERICRSVSTTRLRSANSALPFPPPYLSNARHRETSSPTLSSPLRSMCAPSRRREEQTYFMPSFRIRVPFFVLARLINFTRTRVLIMTRAQRSSRELIERVNDVSFPFFLLFFSLWLADRRWYRCSFRVGEENGRNFCFFFSVASSIPFRVIDRWRRGGGKVAQTRENRIPASERASTPPFKVTAFSSGNSACCKKLTADLALRHVSTTSCAEREVCAREGKRKKEGVGRKKGGQLLLSLQDQLKYPDGWLEKSGGREYEASQQKIK